jgi:transcriptional regulator with XRE-family HTH domain
MVDVLVGKRIRMRRTQLSMSQVELASKLGLTFQQVQKYEKGTNRVSCSRLYDIAKCLEAPISFFFSDGEIDTSGAKLIDNVDLSQVRDAVRLVAALGKINNRNTCSRLADLAETLAEADGKR